MGGEPFAHGRTGDTDAGFQVSGHSSGPCSEQHTFPGFPEFLYVGLGVRRSRLRPRATGRWAPSVPVAFVRGVELAKKRSIQLCPGIIIHCGMVNRCHEAQKPAKDVKPKFPSFAGFPIYFLVDFAS